MGKAIEILEKLKGSRKPASKITPQLSNDSQSRNEECIPCDCGGDCGCDCIGKGW